MMFRLTLWQRFCTQIIKENKNSINPISEYVAFGHYFPKEWTENFILKQIDPTKKSIREIQLVRNRMGQPSGKVLLKFFTEKAMKACIQRYNEDFIITKQSTHRVVIQPFELKTQLTSKETKDQSTKHQVKIKNLDFDITPDQLQRLAKDFGNVCLIDMHMRPNGLNNGIATVHFSKKQEAQDFAYFCDELLYKERKLKAEVINIKLLKTQQQIQYLREPKITLDSHEYIFKKCVIAEKNTHHEP